MTWFYMLYLHSAMPRGPLKAFILHFVPEQYYANVYSIVASFALMMIFYCWHPIPTIIWDVQQPTLWYLIMGKCPRCLRSLVSLLG